MPDFYDPPNLKSEAHQTEGIKAEDLKVLSYRQERGGPLGRQTFIKVSHPVHGEFELGSPMPMSQQAALEWIELTIPAKAFKKGSLDASHILDAGEKEPQLWAEDPFKGLTQAEKQTLLKALKEDAQRPQTCRFCGATNRGTYTCVECEEML